MEFKKIDTKIQWSLSTQYFMVAVLLAILLGNLFFLYFWYQSIPDTYKKEIESPNIPMNQSSNFLRPDQIMQNKRRYANNHVIVQGNIEKETVSCIGSCPHNDQCCGCNPIRNLIISDKNQFFFSKETYKLKLIDKNDNPYCHRKEKSCAYTCGDWKVDSVYVVEGDIVAERPPKGFATQREYIDYYLKVQNKTYISSSTKNFSLTDFVTDIKKFISGLFIEHGFIMTK